MKRTFFAVITLAFVACQSKPSRIKVDTEKEVAEVVSNDPHMNAAIAKAAIRCACCATSFR